MSTTYPTTKQLIPNPTGTDLLDNANNLLDHDYQHGTVNDTVEALQDTVGVTGDTNNTSHTFKLSEVTGGDKSVGKSATQTLTNKTLGSGTKVSLGGDATGDMYQRASSGSLTPLRSTVNGYIPIWNSTSSQWEAQANPTGSDASTTVKGVVQESTQIQFDAGTSVGSTGAKLFTPQNILKTKIDTIQSEFFGDGSNGNVVISSSTTLTADMYYNNLTVNSGINLISGGYRIYVRNTATINGIIHNNGGSGGNGTIANGSAAPSGGGSGGNGGIVLLYARILNISSTGKVQANGGSGGNGGDGISNNGGGGTNIGGGSAGTGGLSGSLSGGQNGVAGADSNSNGNNGLTGTSSLNSSSGVAGGNSGVSSLSQPVNTGGSGGTISTLSKTFPKNPTLLQIMLDGATQIKPNQTSNGSGASSKNPSHTGTTPNYVSGGAGGGSGGNGGVVGVVYTSISNTGTIEAIGGTAGLGGASGGAGFSTNGSAGSAGISGTTILLNI